MWACHFLTSSAFLALLDVLQCHFSEASGKAELFFFNPFFFSIFFVLKNSMASLQFLVA